MRLKFNYDFKIFSYSFELHSHKMPLNRLKLSYRTLCFDKKLHFFLLLFLVSLHTG